MKNLITRWIKPKPVNHINYDIKILKLRLALNLMVVEFGHQAIESNELHAVRLSEKVLKDTF